MKFLALCVVLLAVACVQAIPTFFEDIETPPLQPISVETWSDRIHRLQDRLRNLAEAKHEVLVETLETGKDAGRSAVNYVKETGKKAIDAVRDTADKVFDINAKAVNSIAGAARETYEEDKKAFHNGIDSAVNAGSEAAHAVVKVAEAEYALITSIPEITKKFFDKYSEKGDQ